uniref:Uncharacterized protein n=1 Tax=Setaria viridis TaxID=4556 RepID=A0A4U6U406_SETVI|nr:hypothetical protein SEVIR_6G115750v2 [Setaria viridis]
MPVKSLPFPSPDSWGWIYGCLLPVRQGCPSRRRAEEGGRRAPPEMEEECRWSSVEGATGERRNPCHASRGEQ